MTHLHLLLHIVTLDIEALVGPWHQFTYSLLVPDGRLAIQPVHDSMLYVLNICKSFTSKVHHFRTLAAFITCSPWTATSLWWISQGLTFSARKNRITPRTSQSAGVDISTFIFSTYHTYNVEKFAARTAPGNCPQSTEHTTSLIS